MTAARTPAATSPLDVDGVAAMIVGTAVWAVALAVLLLTGVQADDENGWQLWVCLAGIGIGMIGIAYTRRRSAVYRAAAAARAAAQDAAADHD